jgi:hypothetical protein
MATNTALNTARKTAQTISSFAPQRAAPKKAASKDAATATSRRKSKK